MVTFNPKCVKKEGKVKEGQMKSMWARAMLRWSVCLLQRSPWGEQLYTSSIMLHPCAHSMGLAAINQEKRKKPAYKTKSDVNTPHGITLLKRSTWHILPCQIRGFYFVPLHLAKKCDFPSLCSLCHVRLTCFCQLSIKERDVL